MTVRALSTPLTGARNLTWNPQMLATHVNGRHTATMPTVCKLSKLKIEEVLPKDARY